MTREFNALKRTNFKLEDFFRDDEIERLRNSLYLLIIVYIYYIYKSQCKMTFIVRK